MDAFAHQLAKYSVWVLPLVWLLLAAIAWPAQRAAAVLLVSSGASALLWNFMFMEVDHGQNTQSYWNAVALVPSGDAPVGYSQLSFHSFRRQASLRRWLRSSSEGTSDRFGYRPLQSKATTSMSGFIEGPSCPASPLRSVLWLRRSFSNYLGFRNWIVPPCHSCSRRISRLRSYAGSAATVGFDVI